MNPLRSCLARVLAACVSAVVLAVGVPSVAGAAAPAPAWSIDAASWPTVLIRGDSTGEESFQVAVFNAGGAETDGAAVTFTDTLPTGVTPDLVDIGGSCSAAGQTLTCTHEGIVEPGEFVEFTVPVDVAVNAPSGGVNVVGVSGGGAESVTASQQVATGTEPALFGFLPGAAGFDGEISGADGLPDTQAGSHPYSLSYAINLAQALVRENGAHDATDLRDLTVNLPAGVIANPQATPTRCTEAQLESDLDLNPLVAHRGCPKTSAVGTITPISAGFAGLRTETTLIYNMVPPPGVPAEFGFDALNLDFYVHTFGSVRTGGDYGLSSTSSDINATLALAGLQVTLWGDPSDPGHDVQRGGPAEQRATPPFLTMPSACSGPLTTTASADSWEETGIFHEAGFASHDQSGNPVGVTGCERLAFSPSVFAHPDTTAAAVPAGLDFDLHIPQSEGSDNLAEADLRNAVVTLPAGMVLNPSAANGLVACSAAQIDLSGAGPATCPDASKVGTVEVTSPLVDHPLPGSVYLAAQDENPFGSLLALYIAIDDPATGTIVKLAGHVEGDPGTGQLKATFDDIPQLPFEEMHLRLFGGPRGALVNPGCGSHAVTTALTPWSSSTAVEPAGAFEIDQGCGGGGFAPGFTAGTLSNQAGGFSPFTLTLSRQDGEQALSGLSVKTPPGFSAILKGVERCSEPQAQQGTCGAGSLIGHVTVQAGVGPDPVSATGEVFLTGPYDGAPFGLSVVVPAVAGPFNLGTVVVRSRVTVDPHTAQITIASDPFPTILQGIPLQLKRVNVTVDRPGFAFNPTSCEPLTVTGTNASAQGTTVPVSSHFQAAGCTTLPFKPAFTVSTQAKTSKRNGASLTVKGKFPAGEANIHSVAVILPKQLPARLTTIQQACPEATFATNPATCPTGSMIGVATATTPILANPVVGPTYLVSHGGAAFPDVVAILQGEGVTVDLLGSIDIKKGITSSDFGTVPDAPIGSFTLSLPEGPHSGLAAVVPAKAKGNLCGQSLSMPFTITGQNGAQVKQNVKIAVTGCPAPKKKAKKKPKTKHKAKKK